MFCFAAIHQERIVNMASCFLANRNTCIFSLLADIVVRIESPVASWLETVIEKGQLAKSRPGSELTGEIWSWGLPKEKGLLGNISIDQKHSQSRLLK